MTFFMAVKSCIRENLRYEACHIVSFRREGNEKQCIMTLLTSKLETSAFANALVH